MRKYLDVLFALAWNQMGMADINGDNLQLGLNFPIEKIPPGKYNCRTKTLIETHTTDRIIALNEEILGPKLPEGARVLDAKLMISGTTGAAGIFDLGHKAFETLAETPVTVAEDQDAFVQQADAGGQAVLKRALLASKLGEVLGVIGKGGAQTFVKCTEATTTTLAAPVVIEWHIEYALEF